MNLKEKLNHVVETVPPSGIRKFFDLASSIEGVISLGVGEPDFATPWHIREQAIYAIEKGRTFYTANKGLLELREEIARYLERRFNLTYHPDKNILVTVGGSEAIDLALRALLNPGDEVILPVPGYVAYEPCIMMAGGKAVYVELKEENKFKLTKEALEAVITDKTKVLLLNFPGNPTGGVMSKEDFEPLVEVIKKHEILVVTDEIYAELSYTQKHFSLASFEEIKDQVILISGFSKAYSMTGWRLGYLCANEVFIDAIMKIHQYAIMCPSTISQYAGIEAMRMGDRDTEEMKSSFEQRRNFIVNGLNRIGLSCPMPEGAFYVFPSIQSTGLSSEAFCERLLNEQKVAVVPGSAFGKAGEGFVRISYAYSIDEIKAALQKIEQFMLQFHEK